MKGATVVSNLTINIFFNQMKSLEGVRGMGAALHLITSLFPSRPVQNILHQATGGFLQGTHIWVAEKAIFGLLQNAKVVETSSPVENPTVARVKMVAQVLIASAAATLFFINQQTENKLNNVVQLFAIAAGLGLSLLERKKEFEIIQKVTVPHRHAALLNELIVLHDQMERIQYHLTKVKVLEIKYTGTSYKEKKQKCIDELNALIREKTNETWDAAEDFSEIQELEKLVVITEQFSEGTTTDKTGIQKADPFPLKKEKYLRKIQTLIEGQGNAKGTPEQIKKNLASLKKLQKEAEACTDGVPYEITYGRDELPTKIFYGEKGALPATVSFNGKDLYIPYPSNDYAKNSEFAIEFIQNLINAFGNETLKTAAQGTVSPQHLAIKAILAMYKQQRQVATIAKEDLMPAAVSFHFIDKKGEASALIELKYPNGSTLVQKKQIFNEEIARRVQALLGSLAIDVKKDILPIKQVFDAAKAGTITLAVVGALMVLAQNFTKTSFSQFRLSSNFLIGAQLAWSIGALFSSVTHRVSKKNDSVENILNAAHMKQAEEIFSQRNTDLQTCKTRKGELFLKLKDDNFRNVVTGKDKTSKKFNLKSIGIKEVVIHGKGVALYSALLTEVENHIATLEELVKEQPETIAQKMVAANESVDESPVDRTHLLKGAQDVAFAFSGVLSSLEKVFPKTPYLGPLAKVASFAAIGFTFASMSYRAEKSTVSPVSLFW